MTMNLNITVTDTFSGELNYSNVLRETLTVSDEIANSDSLMTDYVLNHYGYTQEQTEIDLGDETRIDLPQLNLAILIDISDHTSQDLDLSEISSSNDLRVLDSDFDDLEGF